MGIINLDGKNFLVTITEAESVATLNHSNIFKVTKVRFNSLASGKTSATEEQSATQPGVQKPSYKERSIIEDIRNVLEDGFYFSYGYDVTCSRQRRH